MQEQDRLGEGAQSVALNEDEGCAKCKSGDHPFKCFPCEHPGTIEFYRQRHPYNLAAILDEIGMLIVGWKLCKKHAIELDELQQKLEIERTVA